MTSIKDDVLNIQILRILRLITQTGADKFRKPLTVKGLLILECHE